MPAYFLAQDHLQHIGGGAIAERAQLGDHARRHVEPACFQYTRHQCHARQAVVRGLLAHFPQAVVGGEVGVVVAMRQQAFAQQQEVARLVIGAAHPVGMETARQPAEAIHRVPCQVDGVQFDMGDGVDEGRAAFRVAEAAAREVARVYQHQLRGAARHLDGVGIVGNVFRQLQLASAEADGVVLGQRDFFERVGDCKAMAGCVQEVGGLSMKHRAR